MLAVLEEDLTQAEAPIVSTPLATHEEIEVRAYYR